MDGLTEFRLKPSMAGRFYSRCSRLISEYFSYAAYFIWKVCAHLQDVAHVGLGFWQLAEVIERVHHLIGIAVPVDGGSAGAYAGQLQLGDGAQDGMVVILQR